MTQALWDSPPATSADITGRLLEWAFMDSGGHQPPCSTPRWPRLHSVRAESGRFPGSRSEPGQLGLRQDDRLDFGRLRRKAVVFILPAPRQSRATRTAFVITAVITPIKSGPKLTRRQKQKPHIRRAFLVRPRGFEPPRPIRVTRPSTLRVYQFRHRRQD